jgi:hypothetical protein
MIRLRLRRLAARPRSKIQPSRIGSEGNFLKGDRLGQVALEGVEM